VLHSPFEAHDDTMEAWRAMEAVYDAGGAKQLGISNQYDADGFKRLYAEARVKPAVLQNRFYADSGYDIELRAFCKEHGVGRCRMTPGFGSRPHACFQGLSALETKT